MKKQARRTEGLLLKKEVSGEHFLKLHCLSPELGAVICLMRQSSTKRGSDFPDLFDSAELTLEGADGGGLYFVKTYRLLKRRSAIGAQYARLQGAAEFGRLLLANTHQMQVAEPFYDLSVRAFDLLEAGAPTSLVLLKALYLMARDEGYAVRESWFSKLSLAHKQILKPLLFGEIPPEMDAQLDLTVGSLKNDLLRWLEAETDFRASLCKDAG